MSGKKIVDAKRDSDGNISGVRLEGNVSFTPIERAMDMAERGQIENAHVMHLRNGSRYLRSNPDQEQGNSLDEMAKD